MKYNLKNAIITIIVLFLFVQCGCQDQRKTSLERRPETHTTEVKPEITFEKTIHDFGEVTAGKKYTGQFKFTNTGQELLRIVEVKKCCGSVVTVDKDQLAPGESGTLNVEFITGRKEGLISRQITVYSNDKTKPKVTLDIKAQVVVRVDYQPKKIDLLLNKDNAGCPKITITSLDDQPFSIKSFQSTGDTVAAVIDPSLQATSFVLEPKVDLDKLQDRSSGLIAIGLTHPELERISIRFALKPRYQLIPSGIFLLNPLPERPSINKVSIVSNYGEDFEIGSTSSEKGIAKVVNRQPIANGYRLEVEITPPARDETQMFTDVLIVRLKGGEELAIKCYGQYTTKQR